MSTLGTGQPPAPHSHLPTATYTPHSRWRGEGTAWLGSADTPGPRSPSPRSWWEGRSCLEPEEQGGASKASPARPTHLGQESGCTPLPHGLFSAAADTRWLGAGAWMGQQTGPATTQGLRNRATFPSSRPLGITREGGWDRKLLLLNVPSLPTAQHWGTDPLLHRTPPPPEPEAGFQSTLRPSTVTLGSDFLSLSLSSRPVNWTH